MKHSFPTPTLHTWTRLCLATVIAVMSAVSVASALQTVLLQGRVVDQQTGQPVSVRYVISSSSGKNLKGKSTADGTFKQVVNAGESYTITFNNFDILKTSVDFSIPPSDTYYEEKKDFAVRVLRTGDQLLSMAAFENGTSSLKPEARAELEKLAAMLKENRGLEVSMTVAGDEAPKKTVKKSSKKKGKKAVQEDDASAAGGSSALVQARVDALRRQMEQIDASVVKRITFVNSPSPSATANLVVAVGEVKNRFE